MAKCNHFTSALLPTGMLTRPSTAVFANHLSCDGTELPPPSLGSAERRRALARKLHTPRNLSACFFVGPTCLNETIETGCPGIARHADQDMKVICSEIHTVLASAGALSMFPRVRSCILVSASRISAAQLISERPIHDTRYSFSARHFGLCNVQSAHHGSRKTDAITSTSCNLKAR